MKRREWLQRAAVAGAGTLALPAWMKQMARGATVKSPFQLAVITDEISQDFGRAVEMAAKEFGLGFVEIRGLWNKNIVNLDSKEIAEVKRLLSKFELKVTDIASPLFKTDWPGAPKSKFSPKEGGQYGANFTFDQQDEVLERAAAVGTQLGTDQIRCFDFWRLDDAKPYRKGIQERLQKGAELAAKKNFSLILENEFECNTATGDEVAELFAGVPAKNFLLNWDPGNAAMAGDSPYPSGYAKVPKERIGHMHLKDWKRDANGKGEFVSMGTGVIDYVGQFKAMLKDGYRGVISLETHWKGAGTTEESTRQSMAGTKELLRKAGALES